MGRLLSLGSALGTALVGRLLSLGSALGTALVGRLLSLGSALGTALVGRLLSLGSIVVSRYGLGAYYKPHLQLQEVCLHNGKQRLLDQGH